MDQIKPEITVYVEDIPMNVAERYKPIDLGLYLNDDVEIPKILREEYNFHVELFALEVAELREKQKEKEREEEELKRNVETLAISETNSGETIGNDSSSPSEAEDSNAESKATPNVEDTRRASVPTMALYTSGGCILQPQQTVRRMSAEIVNGDCDPNVSNNVTNKRLKSINPADFENDTSSPFDNVELQTIDYMRELNSVFQAVNHNNKIPVATKPCTDHLNGLQLQGGAYSRPILSSSHGVNTSPIVYYQPTNNQQILITQTQQPQSFYNSANLTTTNSLRSSKSVSDLPTLFNPESTSLKTYERSHTPPACSPSSSSNNKPTPKPRQLLNLPDPYEQLSQDEKNLASSIKDMGFERGRVARAVKHLGNDHKKVLDFLFQIQSLEDSGYDCFEAEIALHMNNYQIEEARKFLDSLKQLNEVGFSKDKIVKALVQHGNDRDKALDALLNT